VAVEKILEFKEMVAASKNMVFFGGAGVSTESDIPDFRSKKGLYNTQEAYGYEPEYLLSIDCFEERQELFFRYYKENMVHQDALPNAAHKALAQMERKGILRWIITQNVDGLHQAAGSHKVLELHGANSRQYCVECSFPYGLYYVLDIKNNDGFVPKCDCGGVVRPDVVLYGETLDEKVINIAVKAIRAADLLIVGGTSLAVYPASGLIHHLPSKGKMVLINKDSTPYDKDADLVINDSIGKVLSAICDLL